MDGFILGISLGANFFLFFLLWATIQAFINVSRELQELKEKSK